MVVVGASGQLVVCKCGSRQFIYVYIYLSFRQNGGAQVLIYEA